MNCPSCGATLVAGLRFCRMCGYRLGEGVEEYVPTQRFDASSMPTAAPPAPGTDPFHARQTWGGAPIQPFGATSALGSQQAQGKTSMLAKVCRPVRGWWLWMTIIILVMVMAGMIPLLSASRKGRAGEPSPPITSLMDEADAYVTADGGGAMITGLAGPGSSLEAAGLVGGDVIMSLSGKPIRDAGVLKKLIAETLPGQSLPVTYIHDGETKQTTLTTMPAERFRGMDPIRERPNGRAVLDINFDDGDRVRVPNTNLYGVELDSVERNGPAYLAGLQKGDIIIEFDGKPIRTAGDLRYRAGAAPPLGLINIVVMRAGQQLTIPVKLGSQR
ncbi:MAG: PDZ domain-containing protein [Pyrinomonadaceae bacterium]